MTSFSGHTADKNEHTANWVVCMYEGGCFLTTHQLWMPSISYGRTWLLMALCLSLKQPSREMGKIDSANRNNAFLVFPQKLVSGDYHLDCRCDGQAHQPLPQPLVRTMSQLGQPH